MAGLMMKADILKKLMQFDGCTIRLRKLPADERHKDWYEGNLVSSDGKVLDTFHVPERLCDAWAGIAYNGDVYDVNIFDSREFLPNDIGYVAVIYPVYDNCTYLLVHTTLLHVEVI